MDEFRHSEMKSESRPAPALDFLILCFALAGVGINLILLVRRYSDAAAGIAGCGGGSCDEVLASRWSVVFGIPVAGFGVLVYAAVLVAVIAGRRRWLPWLLGIIAGAAIWLVFVQAVLLGIFCLWCLVGHGIGLVVLGLGSMRLSVCPPMVGTFRTLTRSLAVTFVGIGLMQVYGRIPDGHRLEDTSGVSASVPVQSRGGGRKITFNRGRKSYDVSTLPRLGPMDAPHVMVEYFDYQCAACQKMAAYLAALAAKHPQQVALLLLPVPLDGACNRHATPAAQHPGSCEISRIALAVWRIKPEAFPWFHKALIADPSLESARRLAINLMSPEQLATALADSWIDDLIQADLADWREFSTSNDKLPKLLIRDTRILHGLPSGEADFIRVMEKELGL
jgi:uncharacterized membrane protein